MLRSFSFYNSLWVCTFFVYGLCKIQDTNYQNWSIYRKYVDETASATHCINWFGKVDFSVYQKPFRIYMCSNIWPLTWIVVASICCFRFSLWWASIQWDQTRTNANRKWKPVQKCNKARKYVYIYIYIRIYSIYKCNLGTKIVQKKKQTKKVARKLYYIFYLLSI